MRFEDFEILIARHGTDTAAWPDPALAEPAHVQTWLAAERELDAALAPAPLSANFADRTFAALPDASEASEAWPSAARSRNWTWMGGSVAAALVAAVFVWGPLSAPLGGGEIDEDTEVWSELAEDSGFEELYAWVEGESLTELAPESRNDATTDGERAHI